jgi:hypothetical protein
MHTTKTHMMALATVAAMSIAPCAFAGPMPNNGAAAAARQAAEGAQPMAAYSTTKMAVLYSPFNGIIRGRNVSNVSNPDVGIYCVTPAHAINQGKFYQSVSPEWGWSSGNSLVAMARDNADGYTSCNTGDFEVRTFDLTGAASSVVAFFLEVF